MRKPVVILLHAGYWLLYAFLITFLYFISRGTSQGLFDEDWAFLTSLCFLTGPVSFYAFYAWLVPDYLTRRRTAAFLALGLGVCAIASLLTTSVLSGVVYSLASIFPEMEGQATLLFAFGVLAAVNGLLGTMLRGFVTWYDEIHLKEALAARSLEAELALLKARMNPHFLFNTLHSIDILIEHDPPTASRYLHELSDLLRFVLYETQEETIPLARELEYIGRFVALQKIRTSNEHFVRIEIEGDPGSLSVAPVLFIPYIENAFKYAPDKRVTDGIRILFRIEGRTVHFRCVNQLAEGHRPATTIRPAAGIGQALLRQRLDLLYPDLYQLDIQEEHQTYSVDLTLYDLPAR